MKQHPRYRWVTERGVLLETGERTLSAFDSLIAAALPEVEDLVPADGNLLVVLKPGARVPAGLERLLNGADQASGAKPGREHLIPMVFDGEDFPAVAEKAGLSPDKLLECMLGLTLNVRFLGFQPGFAYLDGLPAALLLPRRDQPRLRVPAGSVALGGGYCGIYPADGPGGWHLIGRAGGRFFDPALLPPARLQPGDTVRFVAA